jgi:hypothetical protein
MTTTDYWLQRIRNDVLEEAAQIAERPVLLPLGDIVAVRPFGKEIAEEIRAKKTDVSQLPCGA